MNAFLANLFRRVTTGVYVIGVGYGELRNAFTAAFVMQVSYDPLLLALGINPRHSSFGLLKQGGVFSVNVLKRDQLGLAAHFGGRASAAKLAHIAWTPGRTGVPLLPQCLAWFECEMAGEHPAGDHVLVLGKVIAGELVDAGAEALIYSDTGAMDGAVDLFPDDFGN
ncbi:MAG: flavin reductase [Methylocapsa sp.]|nr:flavin reductase [Methylocapsa sp.]